MSVHTIRVKLKFYGHFTQMCGSRLKNKMFNYIKKLKANTKWVQELWKGHCGSYYYKSNREIWNNVVFRIRGDKFKGFHEKERQVKLSEKR